MKSHSITSQRLARYFLQGLILILLLPGCKYYYEVARVGRVSSSDVKQFKGMGKYFILHRNDSAWHLAVKAADSGFITGTLEKLPSDHLKYLTTNPDKGNNRYRKHKDNEIAVLDEVHFYVSDSLTPVFATGDRVRLHMSAFRRIEIYQKNRSRTTASWVIPAVVVPVGLVAIIVVLGVLGKNSISLNVSH